MEDFDKIFDMVSSREVERIYGSSTSIEITMESGETITLTAMFPYGDDPQCLGWDISIGNDQRHNHE